MQGVLIALLGCAAAWGQIGKPPEFEEKGAFQGAKGPAAIEGSAHVSGHGGKVNAEVISLLQAAEVKGAEREAFQAARKKMESGETAAAVTDWRQGVTHYPESAAMRCGLAAALLLAGRGYEAGRTLAEAGEKLRGDRMVAAFAGELGQASEEAGEQVLPLVREYAERNPGSGQAKFYLGMLVKRKDAAEAERLWEVAAHQSREDARPCLELGRAAAERGDLKAAAEWLREAVSRDERLEAAHYRLGQIYYRLGDRAKGDAHMRRFRELKEK